MSRVPANRSRQHLAGGTRGGRCVYLGEQVGQAVLVDAPDDGAVVRVEPFPATVGARWGVDTYVRRHGAR